MPDINHVTIKARIANRMLSSVFDDENAFVGFDQVGAGRFNSLRSMDFGDAYSGSFDGLGGSFGGSYTRSDGVFETVRHFLKGLADPVLSAIFKSAVPATAYLVYHMTVDVLINAVKHAVNYVSDVRGTRNSLRDILEQFKEPLAKIIFSYFEDLARDPNRATQAKRRYERQLTVFLSKLKRNHNLKIDVKTAVGIILKKTDKRTEDIFREASTRAREGKNPEISLAELREHLADEL